MKTTLKLARVGMTMEEATVVKWHRRPGEGFAAGDPLYDIETEKVTHEVEAPGDGVLSEILIGEGETCSVGDGVCIVEH